MTMTHSENSSSMFEVLNETDDNVVAIRVGAGTRDGYEELYELFVRKAEEYGSIHVYEEVPDWSVFTFLSHLHGIIPDLRYGPKFDIRKYAAVGDSAWPKLLYYLWAGIRPVWPVRPDTMRYFGFGERDRAIAWIRENDQQSPLTSFFTDSFDNISR